MIAARPSILAVPAGVNSDSWSRAGSSIASGSGDTGFGSMQPGSFAGGSLPLMRSGSRTTLAIGPPPGPVRPGSHSTRSSNASRRGKSTGVMSARSGWIHTFSVDMMLDALAYHCSMRRETRANVWEKSA